MNKKGTSDSELFNAQGYISLRDYLDNIKMMQASGPWKVPLLAGDRIHLTLLAFVNKFSWFANIIFIQHASDLSPAYSIIFRYLQKQGFIDTLEEKNINASGRYAFYAEKIIQTGDRQIRINGQGVANDKPTACSKAMGEITERMTSGVYDQQKHIITASFEELSPKIALFFPPLYHRFNDAQIRAFTELTYQPTVPIEWVEGTNLVTGVRTLIPKQLTSWFSALRQDKIILYHPTTNGSAGYFTKNGAILRALLEYVQRDAFLVHWLTQTIPELVEIGSLPSDLRSVIENFRSRGISLHLLNITALGIPTICVAAINDTGRVPQVVVSAASAASFYEAIHNALTEMHICAGMFEYQPKKTDTSEEVPLSHASSIIPYGKISRQLFWRGDERVNEFMWFISGKKTTYDALKSCDLLNEGDDASRLTACITKLKEYGDDYFPVAYFPKHPAQHALGFHIAQVFIPKAFPFYLYEPYGTFDSERLREFATSQGKKHWELNPLPHMFS